jgi:heme oxygenase (biliverdin-IX-beta and delta-forming)
MTKVPIVAIGARVRTQGVRADSITPKVQPAIGLVHRVLRDATRIDHAQIDRMLLPFDLSKAEDYRIFLNIHFASLATLQADWRQQDRKDFEEMLHCVQVDLKTLGSESTAPLMPPRPATSPSQGLGIAYVVRGSRLGAAVLRRSVVGKLPTSYLDLVPGLPWKDFLRELESVTHDPNGMAEAIRAARSTFSTFAAEFTRLHGVIPTSPL